MQGDLKSDQFHLAQGARSVAIAVSLLAATGASGAANAQTVAPGTATAQTATPKSSGTSSVQTAAPGSSITNRADENVTGPQLEDILVTARKREESLNSVPLAVSAFSSAQLEARGLQNLVDISNFTPGFKFQSQAGGSSGRNDRTINALIFRGLTLVNDNGTRAGSLLFVDGAPIIGGAAPGLQDVERVEILRGPQSAFFGRSTFSGAVNIVTKDPPSHLTVLADASYARFDSHTETLSVGGPIVGDTLSGRVGFTNEDIGGSWHDYGAPYERLGDRRTTAFNAQLLWKPIKGLRLKGSFTAFENKDGPPAQAAIKQDGINCNLNPATVPQSYISTTPAAGNPQVTNPQANNRYYCGRIPAADQLASSTISANYVIDPLVRSAIIDNRGNFVTLFNPNFQTTAGLRRRSYIGSFRLEYDDLPFGLSFASTTSYHQEKVGAILDLDFRDGRTLANPVPSNAANPSNPFYQFTVGYQTKTKDFSQELRLTSDQSRPFRYVVGVNYISADDQAGVIYGQTILGSIFASAVTKFHPRTPAVFGAAYLDFAQRFTLIGELRYQVDKVRQDSLSSTSGVALNPAPTFAQDYSSVSPRITLNFRPVEHSLVYGLFSRGYRPGGFNTTLAPALGAGPQLIATAAAGGYGLSYGQERLDNYEVGFKSRLFGGRVQLNADAYYDEYSNGQISQTVTYVTAAGTVNQAALVGNATHHSLPQHSRDSSPTLTFRRHFPQKSVRFEALNLELRRTSESERQR